MLQSPLIKTSFHEHSYLSQLFVPFTPLLPCAEVEQKSYLGGDERKGGEEHSRLCSKQVGLNILKECVLASLYSRQSLQLTQSSAPVWPPSKKRPESASYDGYRVTRSQLTSLVNIGSSQMNTVLQIEELGGNFRKILIFYLGW